jgi:hypothetical protein
MMAAPDGLDAALLSLHDAIKERQAKNIEALKRKRDAEHRVNIRNRSVKIDPLSATHGARLGVPADIDMAVDRVIQP